MTTSTEGAPEGNESGKEFREKFEATQAENASLRAQFAEQLGVSADDLKGVPADQLVTKATELKQAQAAQEEAVLRKHLGLSPEDDLQAALGKLKGGEGSQSEEQSSDPFTLASQLPGRPVGSVPEDQNLFGRDRIRAALQQQRSKT